MRLQRITQGRINRGIRRMSVGRILRTGIVVTVCTTGSVLGLPQAGHAVDIPPADGGTALTALVTTVESTLTALLAEVNPLLDTLASTLTTVEGDLAPYETDAGVSQATLGALVALGLIEAGGTLPDTCSEVASLEQDIPTSVLGIPISIAEAVGLTPTQVQLVSTYVDDVLQTEEQTIIKQLAPAALALLQVNYNTTFYPTSGAPIVRTTQGYIGLPSLLDVDGVPGLDLCTDTEINIGSLTSLVSTGKLPSITSLSSLNTTTLLAELGSLASLSLGSLKIQQQISKLPLAATTLPVDVNAVLPSLGGLGFGYSTKGSSAPLGYATTIQIGKDPLLSFTDTSLTPGPSLTQTLSLGTVGNLNFKWAPVPASMDTGFNLAVPKGDLIGLQFPNYVSTPSDWTFSTALGTTATSPGILISANDNELQPPSGPGSGANPESETGLAIPIIGLDASFSNGFKPSKSFSGSVSLPPSGTAPPDVLSIGVAPLPTSFDSCSAVASIACSDVNTARNLTGSSALTSLTSMHFTSSSVATTTQSIEQAPTPTVTALTPATGPSIGGTPVTITGTGFAVNAGATIFDFGSNPAGNVVCAKTTSCTATVPAGGVGKVPVTATVDGVTADASKSATYTYTTSSGGNTSFPTPTPTCGDIATNYAVVTGTDVYADTNLTSHIWLDTDGTPISGCSVGLDIGSLYPVPTTSSPTSVEAGPATVTVPAGRLGVFTALALTANSLTKTGTMVCPTGTAIQLAGVSISNWLCPTPPVFTSGKFPVISPGTPAYYGAPETVNNGTITPIDMAATYSYQWQLCAPTAAIGPCPAAPGTDTASSYTPPIPNASLNVVGDTLQVAVTATNSDGSATVTTVRSAGISAPPPPVNSIPPTVTDTSRHSVLATAGDVLSTSDGSWLNGTSSYNYQWLRCTTPANVCTPITGATSQTYTLLASDEGYAFESEVQAVNANVTPSAYIKSMNELVAPTAPTNSAVPHIVDSGSDATGQLVLVGDTLTSAGGTWTPSNGDNQFAYQWEDCNGSACTAIPGATNPTYTAHKSDISDTLELVVTVTNVSGSVTVTTAPTGLVGANDLAIQTEADVADGKVLASTPSSNGTVYVGGTFDTVGPAVGGAAMLPPGYVTGNAAAHQVTNAADATGGTINAIEPDGSGGYFIGGSFTTVQGTPCDALAHITSAGVVDPTYCALGFSGQVNALDLVNGLLAVGGSFANGSDQNLAFISVGSTPTVSFSSVGDPNGAVNAITDDRSYAAAVSAVSTATPPVVTPPNFFIGGAFTALGTSATTYNHLAKFQTTLVSGAVPVETWPAGVLGTGATVNAISASAGCSSETTATAPAVPATPTAATCAAVPFSQIVVGGSFAQAQTGTAAAKNYPNAAEFAGGSTGTLEAWEPDPSGVVTSITSVVSPTETITPMTPASGKDYTVISSNTSVYFGGLFTTIGTTAAHVTNAGEFGLTYQTATSLSFLFSGPEPSSASGTAYASPSSTWTPGFGGQVNALVAGSDGNIYAAGQFTGVTIGTATSVRHRLASVTPAGVTLALNSWDPNAGNTVNSLAQDSHGFYVGGAFLVLGGMTRNNAAEFAGPSGTPALDVTSWNPNVNGTVSAITQSGGIVYLAGSFTSVGGTGRSGLAAVNGSGVVQSWNPSITGTVDALAINGSDVVLGGTFGLSEVDNVGGAVIAAWKPLVTGTVNALLVNGGGVYLGGLFSTVDGQAVSNLAEVDGAAGTLDSWSPTSDGQVSALALIGSTVFIGGSFGNIDSSPNVNLAAVDSSAGALIPGWSGSTNGAVNSLVGLISTVYVGGAFNQLDGVGRAGFGSVSTSTGSLTTFNPGVINGPVYTLSRMSDGTLSVGGSFSQVGPQSTGALALLLTTGSLAPSIKIAPQVNDTTSGGPTSLPGDAVSTTNGIWNNVPTTYTYVWQDCTAADVCSNISGATGSTYTVAPSDVGYSLQSIVTATNTGGMASATSSNQLVVPTAPVNTALPIITDPTGNTAGQMIPNTDVLTASTGTWTPANGDNQYSYQWQDCDAFGANCSQIMGATTSTYTAGSSDVGYTIDVVVTAVNIAGTVSATSAPTGMVINPPAPTGATSPVVTDGSRSGALAAPTDTLSTTNGTWNNSPSTYSYVWQDCTSANVCSNISGATSQTYVVAATDEGYSVQSVVTAANLGGPGSQTSMNQFVVPAQPTNTTAPNITNGGNDATGQVVVMGNVLTAVPGVWTPANGNNQFGYQWEDCNSFGGSCKLITGATGVTYTTQAPDLGDTMRVIVTASNLAGSATATAAPTGAVTTPPTTKTAPAVMNTSRGGSLAGPGDTLSTTNGTWNYGVTTYSYVWQDCTAAAVCTNITGATSQTYPVVSADAGYYVQSIVTATNAAGSGMQTSLNQILVPTSPANSSAPTITDANGNTAGEVILPGDNLTANIGTWTPTNGNNQYSYQWEDCDMNGDSCSGIGGATHSTYQVQSSDVGYTIEVAVTATNLTGATADSAPPTGLVTAPPTASSAPQVSDTTTPGTLAAPGDTLSTTTGEWGGSLATYGYMWQDCTSANVCSNIGGQTGSTYQVKASDEGYSIQSVVMATNAAGSNEQTSSNQIVVPTSPANVSLPIITDSSGNTAGETILQGDNMTATTGSWTPTNGDNQYGYVWEDCDGNGDGGNCNAIPGATSSAYQATINDVGYTLEVIVTATNVTGASSATTDPTGIVVALPPNPTPETPPSVSDTTTQGTLAAPGDVLSTTDGTWNYDPTTYNYVWQDCTAADVCSNITGATSQTYTVVSGDEGFSIQSVVTASNVGGPGTETSSNQLPVPTAPANTTAPNITDGGNDATGQTVTQGDILSAVIGSWSPSNGNNQYRYQWLDCTTTCSNIGGATGSTYTLQGTDVGDTIEVVVIASNVTGTSSATSAPSGLVVLPPKPTANIDPSLTDGSRSGSLAAPGDTLTTTNGTWNNYPPTGYTYVWQDCTAADVCTNITGATSQTYPVASSDEGFFIQSVVTAINPGGSASQTSMNGFTVPAAPSNTTLPSITDSGTNAAGQVILSGDLLTATNGSWNALSGTDQFNDAWEDCNGSGCTAISGATSSTYLTQSTDLGDTIEVVVTAMNISGTTSATSAATGLVQANSPALVKEADVPDGKVVASTPSTNGTEYVGGTFDTVGPPVGGAAMLPTGYVTGNTSPHQVANAADATGGSVNAVEPDGSGGYFLGGSFTAIQGTTCDALAHITMSGALDQSYCGLGISGTVNALDLLNGMLAVGGNFTDGSNANLAFVTVALTPSINFPSIGSPNGVVNAITDDNAYAAAETAASTTTPPTVTLPGFFVGGAFTAIGTSTTVYHALAKFADSLTSGAVAPVTWPSGVTGGAATVYAISTSVGCANETTATSPAVPATPTAAMCQKLPTDQVAVGGSFTGAQVSGGTAKTHLNVAVFGGGTAGALSSWEPDPNGTVTSIASVVSPTYTITPVTAASGKTSYTVIATNTSIYLGGQFTTIGTTASVPAATAVSVSNAGECGITYQTATSVSFLASQQEPSTANGTAYACPSSTWTPAFNGQVSALVAGSDGNIYAGGPFTSVTIGSATTVRHRLASVTPAGVTLALNTWDPNAGNTVNALAQDSNGFYVGGSFLVVGGQTRNNAAEFAGPAGSPSDDVTTWNPNVTGTVDAITQSGGTVYLGGSFSAVGGTTRTSLAAVNSSGTLQSWNPSTGGTVDALAVNGGNVYIGGSFSKVDGTSGYNNLAEVDNVVGTLNTSWNPNVNGPVAALVTGGGGVYLGGLFSQVAGQGVSNLAEVGGTGALDSWSPTTNGQVNALALIGSTMFIGGSFATVDGSAEPNLAAVDATVGAPIFGWTGTTSGTVNALVGTLSTLFVGGAFANVDGVGRTDVASVATSTGAVTSFVPGSITGSIATLARTSDGTLFAGGNFIAPIGTQLTGGIANL